MPEPRRPLSPSEDSHSSDKSPSRQSTTMSHSHRLSAPPHMGTVRRPMSPSEASDSQPPTQFSHAGSSKRTSMPSKRHSSSTKEQTDYRPSTSCSHEGPSKKITDLDRSPTYNTYDIHRSPTYISTPGARLSRSPRRMDTALSSPSASSTNAPNPVEQWIRDVPRLGFEENESEKNYNDATTVGSSSSRTNDSFSHTSAPSPVSSQSPSFRKRLLLYIIIRHLFTDGQVYYRLYDEDGLLRCQHPLQNDDSGLGRISVVQIPPPHIVKSIKRALRKAEKIPESCVIALYVDIEGESELDDDIRIPISGSGPGSDPSNALALVISEKVGTRREQHPFLQFLLYLCTRQIKLPA